MKHDTLFSNKTNIFTVQRYFYTFVWIFIDKIQKPSQQQSSERTNMEPKPSNRNLLKHDTAGKDTLLIPNGAIERQGFHAPEFGALINTYIRQENLIEKELPTKTLLLKEVNVATQLHVVQKGCLRLWFNKDGKGITVQFFFEGEVVSSIDSLINNEPSLFNIESIEPSQVVSINKEDMVRLFSSRPEWEAESQRFLYQRFKQYAQLFLSHIRDSPQERYENLVRNHPEIIKRVPLHYIASYLGITPVSLSRIRNRK